MKDRILTAFVILLFTYLASAQSESTIKGTITDAEGAIIANARVSIHWDPAGSNVGLSDNVGTKTDVVAMTDSNGHYSMVVPPGFYDVFVSAMAFTPTAGKVRSKIGRSVTITRS